MLLGLWMYLTLMSKVKVTSRSKVMWRSNTIKRSKILPKLPKSIVEVWPWLWRVKVISRSKIISRSYTPKWSKILREFPQSIVEVWTWLTGSRSSQGQKSSRGHTPQNTSSVAQKHCRSMTLTYGVNVISRSKVILRSHTPKFSKILPELPKNIVKVWLCENKEVKGHLKVKHPKMLQNTS